MYEYNSLETRERGKVEWTDGYQPLVLGVVFNADTLDQRPISKLHRVFGDPMHYRGTIIYDWLFL